MFYQDNIPLHTYKINDTFFNSGVSLQVESGPKLQAYISPSQTVDVWVDGAQWNGQALQHAAVIQTGRNAFLQLVQVPTTLDHTC